MRQAERIVLAAIVAGAFPIVSATLAKAQTVLSAEVPPGVATPEGRLQIGRGKDYVPSDVAPQVLFDELQASMKKRRDFAWKVIEQVLQPVKIKLTDRDPPSPNQFSYCIEEFPRSAVMIKTSWVKLSGGIPHHDTSATAMRQVIKEGTWPGPGRADQVPPLVQPDRSQIYTNITKEGAEWALTGIHFVTKDVREWVWISLWWDPDAAKDFGADRPASIDRFNNGVWKNYKMCVASSFAEGDPTPWASYTGAQASLGESIKAVYDAIQDQILPARENARRWS
jgi:hypothetical protein